MHANVDFPFYAQVECISVSTNARRTQLRRRRRDVALSLHGDVVCGSKANGAHGGQAGVTIIYKIMVWAVDRACGSMLELVPPIFPGVTGICDEAAIGYSLCVIARGVAAGGVCVCVPSIGNK